MGSRLNLVEAGLLAAPQTVDATRQAFGKLGAVLSSTRLDTLFGPGRQLVPKVNLGSRDHQRSKLSLLGVDVKNLESPSPPGHKHQA